jgi:tetratricopeptide (TPR) repeat protein
VTRDFDGRWDYGDPAGTEAVFRSMLDASDAGDRAYRLELLTQIARCQGLQGRFDEAHVTLDVVARQLGDSDDVPRLRHDLERGRVFNSQGQPDRAWPWFVRAWEAARAVDADFYAIDAAHMLAIVDPPKQAAEWHERALEVANHSGDDRARGWLGSLNNNIGWAHHDAGRFDEALAAFELALHHREARGQEREIPAARWCVGRALRSLGRVEEALEYQLTTLAMLDQRGETDGYVHRELGECLLALGWPDEATPHFERAREILGE